MEKASNTASSLPNSQPQAATRRSRSSALPARRGRYIPAEHRGSGNRNEAEIAAEGTAYVVMHRFGFDTGAYSFAYMAHWFDEKETVKRALPQIHQISQSIIGVVEGSSHSSTAGK